MSEPKRPLGAQISHMLKARGVDTIFGIPGVHNIEMYRGIEEAGITHVLARHEQGVGFMADGYARATGKPGVAYVITGPGLCNIMTPMGQAYSDSVPMLVISSCLNRADLGMGRTRLHEMIDQEAAGAAVCEWSKTAMDADSAYMLIDRFYSELQTNRHRAKHIQVPIEVLGAVAEPAPVPAQLPVPIGASVTQVAPLVEMLHAAKRPLFVFGGGAAGPQGSDEQDIYRELLEKTGAASFTTYAGRGIVSSDYPLHYGQHLARPESARVIASADLVIVVGSELSETDHRREDLGYSGPMVRIDIDPTVLAGSNRATMQVLADARAHLAAVAQALPDRSGPSDWDASEVADALKRWRLEAAGERAGTLTIIDAMKQALPEDTMYFSDMTQIAYVAKEVVAMERSNHWHHPCGFGTLGYALPAAIGGKIGVGDQPVVALMGDYGFQFTLQELGVAVELGLSIPIVLWDNGKLQEIEDSMVRSQIAPNSVVAHNPDFMALAKAYGSNATQPANLAEFKVALNDALAAEGPTLVYVTPECVM